jgi:hypothetical protein
MPNTDQSRSYRFDLVLPDQKWRAALANQLPGPTSENLEIERQRPFLATVDPILDQNRTDNMQVAKINLYPGGVRSGGLKEKRAVAGRIDATACIPGFGITYRPWPSPRKISGE